MAYDLPTVTLNIEREWFADILAQPARKKIEYRTIKPYWDRRFEGLANRRFKVRLLNGMNPPVPEATVMVTKLARNKRSGKYELHLGRVLEVKHWDRKREKPLKR